MTTLIATLSGLVPFLVYFGTALILLMLFMSIYMRLTPNDEIALIKDNNAAASVVLSAAFVGFSIPLASAAANSVNLVDFIVWGLVAGMAQLLVFLVFRRFYPLVSERISKGEIAVSIKLAGLSVTVGLLNAACMTY
jgi:putative membrane protein